MDGSCPSKFYLEYVLMTASNLEDLLNIMRRLRAECPWDKAQTPLSLTSYAIEEAYEVEAAIRLGDIQNIKDELGDLLLQVIFQSQMYSEQGAFDFNQVVQQLSAKLTRRHPHVFGDQIAEDSAAVGKLWAQVKHAERQGQRRRLDEIKPGPALFQAQALQKQAATVGFDWPNVQGAQEKLHEEIEELNQAIISRNIEHVTDELGDCLFALVNVARKLGIQSEMALLGTIHKFRQRFAYIEDQLAERGTAPEHSTLDEMEALWQEAKGVLKASS